MKSAEVFLLKVCLDFVFVTCSSFDAFRDYFIVSTDIMDSEVKLKFNRIALPPSAAPTTARKKEARYCQQDISKLLPRYH